MRLVVVGWVCCISRNCYLCCWLFVSFELGCLALVLVLMV